MAHRKIHVNKEQLQKWYVEEDLSLNEIAGKLGCVRQLVSRRLKECGIPLKAKNGQFQTEFTVDESYFERWSPEMAYLLGYIAADGGVRPEKYELKLKSIDYELLEFAQKQLKTNYQIKPEKGTRCYTLLIYSKKIIDDLGRHGIHARKSLTLQFPTVPDEFFWDYLRGEVDGDGCVFPPGGYDNRNSIGFNIVGSREYLGQLLTILQEKVDCHEYKIRPSGKAGEIALYSHSACKILKAMYDNDRYGLSRKKSLALASVKHFDASVNRVIKCSDCEVEVEKAHLNRKYCNDCSKRREKECRRRYEQNHLCRRVERPETNT